jgi:multisubunit Na+/H+ antiporter MnhG subunit
MSQSAAFYDRFFLSVSAGLLITAVGAALLLVTAIALSRRPEPFGAERAPSRIRALAALGTAIFLVGLAWQVVGYARYVQ